MKISSSESGNAIVEGRGAIEQMAIRNLVSASRHAKVNALAITKVTESVDERLEVSCKLAGQPYGLYVTRLGTALESRDAAILTLLELGVSSSLVEDLMVVALGDRPIIFK